MLFRSPKPVTSQVLLFIPLEDLKFSQSAFFDWKPDEPSEPIHVADTAIAFTDLIDLGQSDLEPEFAAVAIPWICLECRDIELGVWLHVGAVFSFCLLLALFVVLIGHYDVCEGAAPIEG